VTGQPLIDKATKTRSKRRLALDAGTVELLRAHRERVEQIARELGLTLPATAAGRAGHAGPWEAGVSRVRCRMVDREAVPLLCDL
jgi:hypothetical protein